MSELVTIVFRTRGDQKVYIHLPWRAGKKLKDYLRDPALKGHGALHRAVTSRIFNQTRRRVRLTSPLSAGDSIFLVGTEQTEV